MPRLRIVLVEPREAGNVGAAARVMKNFGFDELYIAGEHPPLLPEAGWWASGAADLLDRALLRATLHAALDGAHLTVATTSMRGRAAPVDFTPAALADEAAAMREAETLALVFGREDSGLTGEEMMLCQRTASVPTSASFPTMNLAQSVGIFCYELSSIAPRTTARELAPAAMLERMHERLQSLLVEAGFLDTGNPDHVYDDIRRMLGRAMVDEREATIVMGMVRQIEWALKKA